jgi:hypothetical protein
MQCEKKTTPVIRQFRFSAKQVELLRPAGKDSASAMDEYSDTEVIGLKLAVSKSGRKYFWHRFRFRGRKRMMKLGEFPSLSVADARQMVHDNKNRLAHDQDPTNERNRLRTVPTLAEFAADTYVPYARQHKKTWKDDESKIRRDIGKILGKIPLPEIKTSDVMLLHSTICNRASPATANRFLALLSGMFSLAIKCELIDRNPAKGVRMRIPTHVGHPFRFMSATYSD